jgi:glycosyltransferase involved in cell wall biosynthesis
MLSLLYITSSEVPSGTANSIHCMRMAEAFIQNNVQLTMLARTAIGYTESDHLFYGSVPEIEIIKFVWPKHRLGGLVYGTRVLSHVRRNRETYSVAYGRSPHGLVGAAIEGLTFAYEAHAPPTNLARKLIESWLLRRKTCRGLVVISKNLKTAYLELFPWLDSSRITVLHDGARFPSRQIHAAELPGRYKYPKIGYAGRFYRGKGAEFVVMLARHLPECDFYLLGGEISELSGLGASLPSNVHICGSCHPSEVERYLAAFEILLLPPSRKVCAHGNAGDIARWMSPLKLFEYMGSGRPIIASDLEVLREVLTDGHNALLAPPDDCQAWVNAVKQLVLDKSLGAKLASTALQDFLEKYTWNKRVQAVCKLLST